MDGNKITQSILIVIIAVLLVMNMRKEHPVQPLPDDDHRLIDKQMSDAAYAAIASFASEYEQAFDRARKSVDSNNVREPKAFLTLMQKETQKAIISGFNDTDSAILTKLPTTTMTKEEQSDLMNLLRSLQDGFGRAAKKMGAK